ncbi:MAG TPA: transglycosylase SLT domain-containing protein [Terriglobales bacterium]|nr:transglycosylase SLT domain-containing protein [Terriglobales bacterium]
MNGVVVRWQSIIVFLILAALNAAVLIPRAASQSSTQTTQSAPTKSRAAKAKKKSTSKGKTIAAAARRKRSSPRLRRMHQAFVASATLKPMAQQLIQDRTPPAYAGVQAYAARHSKEDAGALAWLVIGYAHIMDKNYVQAIDPLNRAKPRAGDLGDYVDYYLGTAYYQTGRMAEAVATLNNFEKTYPESLLIRDTHVLYANSLVADGRAAEAIELLEADRQPVRADVELALGRAYEAANQPAKALTVFRNLYYTMPLSWQANQVQGDLGKLATATQAQPVGVEARRTRADLLMKGKDYTQAAIEYHDLVGWIDASERPMIELQWAEALRHSGENRDAKKLLESIPPSTAEINAERLFNLAEIARATDDYDAFLKNVDQLRQSYPTSSSLEQALLSAGNIYLLRHDYDKAIDSYRELQQRFPNGGRASYAHWKVAWLSLRQGRNAEARKELEDQIALYPASSEVPAALYWRARIAEEEADPAMARAFYQKLSLRYRNYYYGELARQRLAKIPHTDDATRYAILDRVPPLNDSDKIAADPLPDDNLRVQKAELLANGALLDLAARELHAAAQEEKGDWAPAELARLYQEAGRYDAAIDTLKRAAPNYFAVDLPSLPRSYWEGLFPKPFWTDVKRFSSENGLDPYLVAALIRQESAFNPNAVSRANAVGLMQLLPKVGRGVAKQEKMKHFTTQELFQPRVNLQLGTKYFRSMVDRFGSFEYALAAYNAGVDRVQDWSKQGTYRDPQEFVESIPFTETREYVENIMRNVNVYRQLYGTP